MITDKKNRTTVILCLAGVVFVFALFFLNGVFKLNLYYAKEENEELLAFAKLARYAALQAFENNNIGTLKFWLKEFNNEEVVLRILTQEGEIVAQSNENACLKDNCRKISIPVQKSGNVSYDIEVLFPKDNVLAIVYKTFIFAFLFLLSAFAIFVFGIFLFLNERRQKEIKVFEEYKADFINNIIHEIKTPVTAINLALELINKDIINSEDILSEAFDIVSLQVKYMNSLISDILSLAEIQNEKKLPQKKFLVFNLSDAVMEIINVFSAEKNKIVSLLEKDIYFSGNAKLIKTAVSNLIINAIEHSKTDIIEVCLAVKNKEVIISVRDFGIGIEEKNLKRIFEKFYRIDKFQTGSLRGTGLGLSIVKNVAEIHNGRVFAESKTGLGSCFTIILPFGVK